MVLTTEEPVVPKEFERMTERQLEEEFVDLLRKFIASKKTEAIRLLDQYHRGRVVSKALTDTNILTDFTRILSPIVLLEKVRQIIKSIMEKAAESVEDNLNVNITRNPQFQRVIEDRAFSMVKGMTDDLANELKRQMMLGWATGEGIEDLKARIKSVWANGNLTDARAEMIARTESNLAYNATRLQSAKESGIRVMKRWNAYEDSRTGEDSLKLNGQVRHINDDFYDSVNNVFIPFPPNRPNCRCRLDIIPL